MYYKSLDAAQAVCEAIAQQLPKGLNPSIWYSRDILVPDFFVFHLRFLEVFVLTNDDAGFSVQYANGSVKGQDPLELILTAMVTFVGNMEENLKAVRTAIADFKPPVGSNMGLR